MRSIFIPRMNPIASEPSRHPLLSEQSILTYGAASGAWELVNFEFGEPLDAGAFEVGVSHWIDLADFQPSVDEDRQALWEEEAEATYRDAGLTFRAEAELVPVSTAAASVLETLRLSLGLMVAKADGTRAELDCLGYQRQLVELSPRSPTHLGVGRPVLFEILGCPPVTGLALFNTAGQVVAEGPLRGTTAEVPPPARFEFAAHQILVRRPAVGPSVNRA